MKRKVNPRDLVTAMQKATVTNTSHMRQGVIVSCEGSTVTVKISGADINVTGIKYSSTVCPIPNSTCWLVTDGRDWFVTDVLAPAGPAFAVMRKSTAQSIGNASFTGLTWASRTDTSSRGITLTDSGLQVDVPGIYSVTGNITFAGDSTGLRHTQLWKNGSVVWQGSSVNLASAQLPRLPIAATLQFAAGDVINLAGYQNSGSSLNTDVNTGANIISAVWVAPSV
jgi:hypothetical protein